MITIKELIAKVGELETGFKTLFAARADDAQVIELRNQLNSLSATVNEKLTQSDSEANRLASVNATISAEAQAINETLTAALTALKLDTKADATSAEKIQALSEGVSATLAKLAVDANKLPDTKADAQPDAKPDFSKLSGLDKSIAANRVKHEKSAKK
jgi:signal transduction histidine kinase